MADVSAEGDGLARPTLGRMRKVLPAALESEPRLPGYEIFLRPGWR